MNFFDWKLYTLYYKDLRDANINTEKKAIDHWKTFGKKENRIPNCKKLNLPEKQLISFELHDRYKGIPVYINDNFIFLHNQKTGGAYLRNIFERIIFHI
jgi:hypothetical protein